MVRCKWKRCVDHNDDSYWERECGDPWRMSEGGLKDNKVKFCPFCGKEIKEVSGD